VAHAAGDRLARGPVLLPKSPAWFALLRVDICGIALDGRQKKERGSVAAAFAPRLVATEYRGEKEPPKAVGLVLHRGLAEQLFAQVSELGHRPEQAVREKVGVADRVERQLALVFGHVRRFDPARYG
jgi:hypothetical protein